MLILYPFNAYKLEIAFNSRFWALILVIGLGFALGITALMYYRIKENKELTRLQQRSLMILRFLTIFFIVFLFAGPLIQTIKKITQNPVIILAMDNSLSMRGISGSDSIQREIVSLQDQITSALGKQYDT